MDEVTTTDEGRSGLDNAATPSDASYAFFSTVFHAH